MFRWLSVFLSQYLNLGFQTVNCLQSLCLELADLSQRGLLEELKQRGIALAQYLCSFLALLNTVDVSGVPKSSHTVQGGILDFCPRTELSLGSIRMRNTVLQC